MPKTFEERTDDYKDTVFAIIGFANLFRFDNTTRTMSKDVKMSQGRRMDTSSSNKGSPNQTVTPDLVIQLDNKKGILAEVKLSFPKNHEFWEDDFAQLISYDDNLSNWWTKNKIITNHDIVLILHQTRGVAIQDYYLEKKKNGTIKFDYPFSIIEVNRSDQAKQFYFFRKTFGEIAASEEISNSLRNGVSVPMEKLMLHYEKHKIYDSEPPMPYFLYLLWENVVLRWAAEKPDFINPRKNITIETTVEEITFELYDNCSFKGFNFDETDHQPKLPHKNWVIKAINSLVNFQLAEWIDPQKGSCKIVFKRMNDVFQEFIKLCKEHQIDTEDIENGEQQKELFSSETP